MPKNVLNLLNTAERRQIFCCALNGNGRGSLVKKCSPIFNGNQFPIRACWRLLTYGNEIITAEWWIGRWNQMNTCQIIFISRKCVHRVFAQASCTRFNWRNVHVDPTSCARFASSLLEAQQKTTIFWSVCVTLGIIKFMVQKHWNYGHTNPPT